MVQDGSILLRIDQEEPLSEHALRAWITHRVELFEDFSPRMREFVEKAYPPTVALDSALAIDSANGHQRLQYEPESRTVSNYLLSNAVQWDNFPEIAVAHRVVANVMPQCQVDQGSYTTGLVYGPEPYLMSVGLRCNGIRTDAEFRLWLDGRYDGWRVIRYDVHEPGQYWARQIAASLMYFCCHFAAAHRQLQPLGL